jgi:hypothetical protein
MAANMVTFFIPELSKIDKNLSVESPDFWKNHGGWTNIITYKAWLYYTYIQLRETHAVQVSDVFPLEGIVVILADKKSRKLLDDNYKKLSKNVVIVVVRADELEFRHLLSDIEIVQNGKYANNKNCFFVPHWPHPGIIPRDKDRETTVKNIVYKGGLGNLDEMFLSKEWREFIEENNLNFVLDTEEKNITTYQWHNYTDADIIVAVRPSFGKNDDRSDKPALKLVNCWFAGVPAILGKEYAFLEQRKTNLDYIEATTIDKVIASIKMLMDNPKIYKEMVENGLKRSQPFTPNNIAKIWSDILLKEVPKVQSSFFYKITRLKNDKIKKIISLFFIDHTFFEWRKRIGFIYRARIKS